MDEIRTTYCCILEGFDSSKQPFKSVRSQDCYGPVSPTTVSIASKPQKSGRSTQHLGCFKAEAAALEETFLLKDSSRD